MQCCVQAGFAPQVAQTTVELAAMLSLVAAGLGVALVPSSMGVLFGQRCCSKRLVPRHRVPTCMREGALGVVPAFVRVVAG